MRKLYSLKLQLRGPVQRHINELAECCQQLAAQDKVIDDKDKNFLLLSSLPPEYNPLLSALETVEKDQLTFAYWTV